MQKKKNLITPDVMSPENFTKPSLQEQEILEINENLDELIKNEKFLSQLTQSNKKIITVGQLPELLKNCFAQVTTELNNLCNDIVKKKEEVLSRNALIKHRVNALLTSGKVHVNQTEYQKSDLSVLQYATLLDNICLELKTEYNTFILFLDNTHPTHVIVRANASDSFAVVAQKKVNFIKHHIKTIHRDLLVSYSRYCYGFDAQLKRITHVESLTKKEKE